MKKSIIVLLVLFLNVTLYANNDRALYIKQYKHESKTALVIGNSNYSHFSKLKNSKNDAYDMQRVLKKQGFDVLYLKNGTQKSMDKIIRKFTRKLKNGGVGIFYYAGHGVEVEGKNYLIPVDADIPEQEDVKYKSIPINMIVDKMERSNNRLNIVVLDACRNDPYSRSGSGGLAQINSARGMYIAFATAPGSVASDGSKKERNGLFTKHLIQNIKQPNIELDRVFKNVRIAVSNESNDKQRPWTSSSVNGDFYFKIDNKTNTQEKVSSDRNVVKQEKKIVLDNIATNVATKMLAAELLSNLPKTKYTGKDFDYGLKAGGIRVAYYYLATYLPYKTLYSLSPYPIYLSGPHSDTKLNLDSPQSFGHYNPEFLDWFYLRLKDVLNSDTFVQNTKKPFKEYLGTKLLHYIEAYKLLEKNKNKVDKLRNNYKDYFTYWGKSDYATKIDNSVLSNKIDKIPNKYEKDGYYIYNGHLAALFWFRRYEDGTDKKIYKILDLFYSKYYK